MSTFERKNLYWLFGHIISLSSESVRIFFFCVCVSQYMQIDTSLIHSWLSENPYKYLLVWQSDLNMTRVHLPSNYCWGLSQPVISFLLVHKSNNYSQAIYFPQRRDLENVSVSHLWDNIWYTGLLSRKSGRYAEAKHDEGVYNIVKQRSQIGN